MRASESSDAAVRKARYGVIEGFFGRTWSWPARLETLDFLAAAHLEFYVYAPKAEAFLRRRWHEPLPGETVAALRTLAERAGQLGITLGAGLTPYEIYLNYDAAARAHLRAKIAALDDIGVGMLCLLFDDMRGDVDALASLQARIVDDVASWTRAAQLIVCPTYYSSDPRLAKEWGDAPAQYLADLGRLLDPRIDVFWTGEKIISDSYSVEHLEAIGTTLRRRPFIWDNHGSNDARSRTGRLFLDPMRRGWSVPRDKVAGIAFNPMNEPALARIALAVYAQALELTKLGNDPERVKAAIHWLCTPPVAADLLSDLSRFEDEGLSGFKPEETQRLAERYARHGSDVFAREILDWARGGYAFDPACLTD